MKVVTFKLEEGLLYLLDELAEKQGKARSEIIREAILQYLRKQIRG